MTERLGTLIGVVLLCAVLLLCVVLLLKGYRVWRLLVR
jgi:hypothetical protein